MHAQDMTHVNSDVFTPRDFPQSRAGRDGDLSQGFWSGGDFGPGGPKSPESGQIKRSGPGILVRALKSLSSFVYQRPCMFQHAACTPGLPDEVK